MLDRIRKSRPALAALVVTSLFLAWSLAGPAFGVSSPSKLAKKALKNSKKAKKDARTAKKLAQQALAQSGKPGPPGRTGVTGATGPRGPSDGYFAFGIGLAQVENKTTLATLNVPAGSYLITAKTVLQNEENADRSVECEVAAGDDGDLAKVGLGSTAELAEQAVTLVTDHTFGAAGQIVLSCDDFGEASDVSASNTKIAAIRVARLTTTFPPAP